MADPCDVDARTPLEALQQKKPGKGEIKIVLVGDGAVGKTCVCSSYIKQEQITKDSYIPTVFDVHKATATYKDEQKVLLIWDTAGQEDLSKMRLLAYQHTNVFLLCFSLNDRKSFNKVKYWKEELKENGPDSAAIVLVGTKKDLRDQNQASQAE